VLLTDNNALGKTVEKEICDAGGTAVRLRRTCDEAQWAATVGQAEKTYGSARYPVQHRRNFGPRSQDEHQTSHTAGRGWPTRRSSSGTR
jgi:hypothetical protein